MSGVIFLEVRIQQESKLGILTVLDEFIRGSLEIRVAHSISSAKVIDRLCCWDWSETDWPTLGVMVDQKSRPS